MQKPIIETEDKNYASELYLTGEWSKPIWSETKAKYIIILKARFIKQEKGMVGERS